jgi:hypothetical protein
LPKFVLCFLLRPEGRRQIEARGQLHDGPTHTQRVEGR